MKNIRICLRKHRALITAIMVALGGCGSSPTRLAFEVEYDWSKPSYRTPDLKIQVTLPTWVVESDREAVLKVIDSYARGIITKYPHAGQFWWGDVRVFIHECVTEKIVCYYPAIWCSGWQMSKRVYLPFCPGDELILHKNCFDVLPHEWFHVIIAWELGVLSAGHEYFTAEVQAADSYAQNNCLDLVLSDQSIQGALKALPYKPWLIPGE